MAKLYTNLQALLSMVGFTKTQTGDCMKPEQNVSPDTLRKLATAEFRSSLYTSLKNQEKRKSTVELVRQLANAEFYDPTDMNPSVVAKREANLMALEIHAAEQGFAQFQLHGNHSTESDLSVGGVRSFGIGFQNRV